MEGKLAETAPKRPLALTIGAAAATLVVIFGVLTGPAIVSCFNSEDGLGLCLRGKMAEVGLVPPLPEPATAEAETATEETSSAIAEEAVSSEPELDVTPPADAVEIASADAADDVIAATFGLLRAEPDGSMVIAGSGTPGSKVEVFANGQLLGKVDVESSGDWVFVPDAPLAAGDLEITLGEEGKSGTADQSFIVVLNEDRTTQPLVVASAPGQASEVLQGLNAPEVATATEPASAPETVEVAQAAPAEQPAAKTQDVAAAIPAEPAEEMDAVVAEPAAAIAEEPALAVAATAEGEPAIAEAPETDVAALTEPVASEPAAPQVQPEAAPVVQPAVVADAPLASEPEAVVAAVPDAAVAETPAIAVAPLADVQPSIDAIELEGARTFFAGAGPTGGIIRLYVDDGFVADATIAEGRWLVEAGPVLSKPSQRVRADLIQPATGAVLARSEVDFVVDLPAAGDQPIAVADADVPEAPEASPSESTVEDAEPAAIPAETPVAAAANVEAAPPAEAVVQPEPAAQPASQPASEPAPVQAVEPAPEPQPKPATVAEPVVPKMVAVSLGDPEAQRFASGKAIIRRGDNLWTIARRVYGEGLKYTTIYQANNAHIRDPDRIYPGQVFDLPAGQ
ncbi:LysM peptidoglycan-binding domain-containing protein [Devosia faecipullorum]|uniref:LysM peptidoglycan-binding domain-containing protein n=1 Tax=Devosia faecipullorum TaxID=2755039 RepID=UPI00187B7F3C|nr:LysM peptidoglycan-binding domain-containing protein [Devosia faecipullorum]